jgi:hypothetical protein
MILGLRLNPIQALIIAVLLGVLFVAGFSHWMVVARASRLKDDDGGGGRLFPFGFGSWHIGMLRRSWYPAGAQQLYKWSLIAYITAMTALLLIGGLLLWWVVLA